MPDGPDETRTYVEAALEHAAGGRAVPFAVRRLSDDTLVGSTRFLDLEVFQDPAPWPPGIGSGGAPSDENPPSVAEIGSTWYAASAQRTAIDTETKLLLLTHAFETWRSLRVTLKTMRETRRRGGRWNGSAAGSRASAGSTRSRSTAACGTPRTSRCVAAEWFVVRAGLGAAA